jgi:CBS domain-containing protein
MTTAREIMTPDTQCIGEHDTLQQAAHRMGDLHVGALPICGDDNRLKGMVTDRDIALRIGEGEDGSAQVRGGQEVVTIGADDSLEEVLRTMADHQVRRLPVIDGHDLVGMISQADIARNCRDETMGALVEAVSRS